MAVRESRLLATINQLGISLNNLESFITAADRILSEREGDKETLLDAAQRLIIL